MIGIGVNIVIGGSRVETQVGLVATAATGIGITSFTANWNAFSGAQYYLLDVSTSSSFSTFVYQDQVVLAPTTSYVVIGLTENTTYYYRLRASTDPYVDPDYLAFYNRVIAAGGTLTPTEQVATNQLVLDLKANSLWTPMKAIYPMVGASAAACAQNLKSSSFTGTFTSGWTFASTGVTPDGFSAYMDSNCQVSSQITRNSGSFGMYFNTDRAANQKLHGAYSSSNSALVGLYPRYSGNVFYAYLNTQDGVNPTSTPSNTLGLRAISRTSITNNIIQVNSTQTIKSQTSLGDVPLNFYIGACNTNGTATDFDSIRIAFTYLSLGLDSTQMSNLYTNIQAFQTTLSRNV